MWRPHAPTEVGALSLHHGGVVAGIPEEETGRGEDGKEDSLDSPADAQMGRMTDRWTERREDRSGLTQTPAVASRMNNRARTRRTDGKDTKNMTFSEAGGGGGGARGANPTRLRDIW